MTKSEFTTKLAESCGMSVQEAEKILNAFLDSMEDGICKDGRVALPGFGIFEVKETPARKGRNPATGEDILIPAKKVLRFKIGKDFKQLLNADS